MEMESSVLLSVPEIPLHPYKVLVICYLPEAAVARNRALRAKRFFVTIAIGNEAAARAVKSQRFDAVVLGEAADYKSRLDLLRFVRWAAPQTPIVAVAQDSDEDWTGADAVAPASDPQALAATLEKLARFRRECNRKNGQAAKAG